MIVESIMVLITVKGIMKRLAMFMGVLAIIAGCTTKENGKVEKFETVHLVLGVDDLSTRTIMDGRDIKWQSGDVVGVWDGTVLQPFTVTSAGSTGTILEGDITTSTEDKGYGSIEEGKYALVSQYDAVYPYSYGQKTTSYSNGSFSLDIPTEQQAIENTFQPGANIAVASFTAAEIKSPIEFKNALAYGKISIATDADDAITTLDKITIVAFEMWSGAVTVGNDASVSDGTDASHLITITKPAGGFQKGETYYFTVKPGTYSRLDLVGTTESGQVHKVGANIKFERNTITNLGSIKNQMTLTLWDYVGQMKTYGDVELLLISEDGANILAVQNRTIILVNPNSNQTIDNQLKSEAVTINGNSYYRRFHTEGSPKRYLRVSANGEIHLDGTEQTATNFLCYEVGK